MSLSHWMRTERRYKMQFMLDSVDGYLEIMVNPEDCLFMLSLLYYARKGMDIPLGLDEEKKGVLKRINAMQKALIKQEDVIEGIERTLRDMQAEFESGSQKKKGES